MNSRKYTEGVVQSCASYLGAKLQADSAFNAGFMAIIAAALTVVVTIILAKRDEKRENMRKADLKKENTEYTIAYILAAFEYIHALEEKLKETNDTTKIIEDSTIEYIRSSPTIIKEILESIANKAIIHEKIYVAVNTFFWKKLTKYEDEIKNVFSGKNILDVTEIRRFDASLGMFDMSKVEEFICDMRVLLEGFQVSLKELLRTQ